MVLNEKIKDERLSRRFQLVEVKDAVLKGSEDNPETVGGNYIKSSEPTEGTLRACTDDELMNVEKSLLIQLFGDTRKTRILDFLIENKGQAFTKRDISKGAHVSETAFFKQDQKKHHYDDFGELFRLGVVKPVKNGGRSPKYTINTENKVMRALLRVEVALIEQSMKQELQKCAKEGVEVNF